MKTKICKGCGKEFNLHAQIDGKRRNLSARAYCLECSPFNEYRCNGADKTPMINGHRRCARCGKTKPISEFRPRNRKNISRGCCSYCDPCEIKRQKECIQKRNKLRRELKIKAVEYLGGKCQVCGYNRCMRSLHFHHKDKGQKDFTIGKYRQAPQWEKIREELDKCVLVCANCHGELHDDEKSEPG
jgi:hypothetical protein